MNLPPLPLIDGCLFIDNSHAMDPLQTCDRLFEYQFLHQRISASEGTALNFGSAQHLTREFRYKVYKDKPLDQPYFGTCAQILSDFYGEHPVSIDDWRNLNWAKEVSEQYDKRWLKEQFQLMQYDEPKVCDHCQGVGYKGVLMPFTKDQQLDPCPFCSGTGKNDMMVELSFALPLYTHTPQRGEGSLMSAMGYTHEIPVFYTGRIDLPILLDNRIWVMDFKTTSMLGEIFWNRMKMSSQQRGYCWSFKQLTGKDVAGYIVRAIRTKEPPLYVTNRELSRKGKAQSPEQWWEESLQENKEYVTNAQLEEWKFNTIELIEKMFWQYSRGYFPMSTESCTKWNRCQYFDVCSTVKNERGVVLSSGLYKQNEWSPLKKTKT